MTSNTDDIEGNMMAWLMQKNENGHKKEGVVVMVDDPSEKEMTYLYQKKETNITDTNKGKL